MSAAPLVWTKSKAEPRAYETSIGDVDVRIVGVDDIYFVKTRRDGAPFGHPKDQPVWEQTLRAAKARVQATADKIADREADK